MAVLGLDHYNIRAPSPLLEELRDFYVAMVGLQVGPRPLFRSFGYWLYAGGKDVLHLSQTRVAETRAVGAVPTFDHVAFACENFEAMVARLAAAGIEHEIDEVPLTRRRQVFFRDPAGNGIELNFGWES
ncbi:MAG: VOC family protein [Proteobacteria bacterium]|uniref:VOC family protein n=1 Tax=Rudaea sp. TaxID=2136325 RepID=UPI0032208921|nr:VOC family protein [Pseudomonadota bacterium]